MRWSGLVRVKAQLSVLVHFSYLQNHYICTHVAHTLCLPHRHCGFTRLSLVLLSIGTSIADFPSNHLCYLARCAAALASQTLWLRTHAHSSIAPLKLFLRTIVLVVSSLTRCISALASQILWASRACPPSCPPQRSSSCCPTCELDIYLLVPKKERKDYCWSTAVKRCCITEERLVMQKYPRLKRASCSIRRPE